MLRMLIEIVQSTSTLGDLEATRKRVLAIS